MLTMKTRYALQALTLLAERPGATVLIADLAQRGRHGGYSLNLAAGQITLANIVQALNGALAPTPCANRTPYQPCDECKNGGACSVRLVLEDLHDATAKVLEGTTLADLARRTHEARDPSPLKYAI